MSDKSIMPRRNVVRLKALQRESRRLDVIPLTTDEERYHVASGSTSGRYYEVVLDPVSLEGRCSCPWAEHGGVNCKHVLAVLQARFAPEGRLSFWQRRQDARRQHRRVIEGDGLFATLRR